MKPRRLFGNHLLPSLSLLALACVAIPGGAIAEETNDPLPADPQEAPAASDPAPEATDLLPPSLSDAPEVVLEALDISLEHAGDVHAAAAAVSAFVATLPPEQTAEIANFYEAQVDAQVEQIEQQYIEQAAVDPDAAAVQYAESMAQIEGYDGDAPSLLQGVPPGTPLVPIDEALLSPPAQPETTPAPEATPPPNQGAGGSDPNGPSGLLLPQPSGGGRWFTDAASHFVMGFGEFLKPGVREAHAAANCVTVPAELQIGKSQRCDGEIAHVYIHGMTGIPAKNLWENQPLIRPAAPDNDNVYVIQWNGMQSVQSEAHKVEAQLDILCNPQRQQKCVVYTHSAGGLMMGYILSRKNRWSILGVNTIQSAEGGSELATLGAVAAVPLAPLVVFGVIPPIAVLSLPVPVARAMYDHDVTHNVPFTSFSSEYREDLKYCKWYQLGCHGDNLLTSAKNAALFVFYKGDNDKMLGYHSTAGFRKPNWGRFASSSCNPEAPSTQALNRPFSTPGGERDTYYWKNHASYHWGPGQNSCGQGFDKVLINGKFEKISHNHVANMLTLMPKP